jgi:hypothetical protein
MDTFIYLTLEEHPHLSEKDEIECLFTVSGSYVPNTYYQPAEYPDVDFVEAKIVKGELKNTRVSLEEILEEYELEELKEMILLKVHDEEPYSWYGKEL